MTSTTLPRTNIFFAGTVHEAIATSVQQRLALVCFVSDGGEESSVWEADYLIDTEVFALLQSDVIILRLEAGSHEASLLAEVCPVNEIPHLLVIKDGALLAKLTAGASREDFIASLKKALAAATSSTGPSAYPTPSQSVAASAQQPQPQSPPPQPIPASAPVASSSSVPSSSSFGARPETSRREHTPTPFASAATAETSATTSGRRGSIRPASQSYIEQQRQKKLAEQAERQRILQLVENDKAERRVRERERRDSILIPPTDSPRPRSVEPPSNSAEVALSFRLTDGSNVKSRFPSSAVLGRDVRLWIEQNRTDGDHPYNFMEILSPSQNRQLDISDESLPLSDLFKRSATLVLVPTQTFTSAAYEDTTASGYGLLSQVYGVVSSALDAIWSLGSFAPRSEEQPPPPPPRREGRRIGTAASNQVRTLRNPGDDGAEKKYYNGNQLNFEPKPDGSN